MDDTPSALSTGALQSKLRRLREQSQAHSQLLTQKLASSQSGQNLLHIGTSLSSLPPDLHSLLSELHPVLAAAEQSEKEQRERLQTLVDQAAEIRIAQRRVHSAAECARWWADLQAAEASVQAEMVQGQQRKLLTVEEIGDPDVQMKGEEEDYDDQVAGESMFSFCDWRDRISVLNPLTTEELDHVSSLERAAHITLCLVQELQSSTETVSVLAAGSVEPEGPLLPTLRRLEPDGELAQFVMRLAPRIRRLESDTTRCLQVRLESVLKRLQECRQQQQKSTDKASEEDLLLMLGHCMRGMALLGRGKEVESIFARVAIMPMIRSKLSMGRLDEGGARGECAGLKSLLEEMVETIATAFSPLLRLSSSMFRMEAHGDERHCMEVDLVTDGVWVPIATALMADAGIKMAIFSPGIASILQANYTALDVFLSQLARRLLQGENGSAESQPKDASLDLYFQPTISAERILEAQDRIYAHPKTAEFSKKWNLPIYYQLRFGECCTRLNKAVDLTKAQGWTAEVFSGSEEEALSIKHDVGFELSLFLELYDILLGLWSPDVILRPLTNRFLRGAVQLVGRVVAFVKAGMDGTIKFGEEPQEMNGSNGTETENGGSPKPSFPTRNPYSWGESEQDVAAVAWELTILDSTFRHDYVNTVCTALETADATLAEQAEIRTIVAEVLSDASDQIHPLIDKAWNEHVVELITAKCSKPLAAVKGVAATYRMTNRPPPTQASPFVATILRPLKEFSKDFSNRTPDRIGSRWKHQVVVAVADRYAAAVEELITTVQRTEEALSNRRARRTAGGGMRDGEKVKLQLYLDYQMFAQNVREAGVDPATVIGLSKLRDLTAEGEGLMQQIQNGT